MPVIQRIRSAPTPETAPLYIRGSTETTNLPADTRLSFNTYFNCFHEAAFLRHCDFGNLAYEFRLQGDFRIRLFRADLNVQGEDVEIASRRVNDCRADEPTRLDIPAASEPGRVYAELTCLKAGSDFLGGDLIGSRVAEREVELAIVICTFKKEDFVQATVRALTDDVALIEKKIGVYIADNAGTLSPEMFPDARVRLLPGKNAGGAGGFTRGLMEARENSRATHFLVMDDDVELDSESILRLITFQEYARDNPAVAGAMLNLSEKTRLVTAGGDFDRAQATGDFAPFTVRCLQADADLADAGALSRLNHPAKFDFGGFWFFAFDREVLEELGNPLPFFIKGDDAEYGIRTGSMRTLAAPPSICVWHEPPERKPLSWEIYYHYRNSMIIHDLHYDYSAGQSLTSLAKYFLFALFTFRYNFCELMLRGLRDYRRGPEYLGSLDPEILHGEIRGLASKHATGLPAESAEKTRAAMPPVGGLPRRLLSLASLGGHLWPSFLGGVPKSPLVESGIKWYSILPARQYRSRTEFAGDFSYRRRSWTGIVLSIRFALEMTALLLGRSSRKRRWRRARDWLTSSENWKKYLGL